MIRNLLFIILVFAMRQSGLGQCIDQTSAKLDWDQASWLDGVKSCGYGFGTNALQISVKGNTMFPGYPNQLDEFAQSGGWSDGGQALVITNMNAGSISIELAFQSPANNIRFSLYDIDLKDEVIIETDGSLTHLAAESDEPTFSISGNEIFGDGTSSDKDERGTVNIEIAEAASISITISRLNGNIYTGISDILACVDAPPVFTACQPEDQMKLSWDEGTEGYPAGALQHSIQIPNSQGTNVEALVIFEGDADHLTATKIGTPSPDDTPRFSKTDGGLGDGSNPLKIRMDGPANAESSTITTRIQFNQSVEDARFSIYDIDNHTLDVIDTADRRDQVTVLGFNHGIPVAPVIEAISNSPAWDREGSVLTAHPFGEYDSEDGGTRNTANIYFTKPVNEIVITYDEKGYTDPNKPEYYDPKVRIIALTPIFFCPPVLNGEVGGQLYVDLDKSQDLTSLDMPVSGATLYITDQQGEQRSVISHTDGSYLFKELGDGVYEVSIDEKTLPMVGLYPLSVNNGNKEGKIILESGRSTIEHYNMGFEGANNISGRIFTDITDDGAYRLNEDLPLPMVSIDLIYDGSRIQTTSSSTDGSFAFDLIPAGTYTVAIKDDLETMQGLTNTLDPDGKKPNRSVLKIFGARSETTINFGYQGQGTIGDQLFMDQNNNGQYDDNDTPLSFINLLLVNGNEDTLTISANGLGRYLVEHLPYGTYLLMIPEANLPTDAINTVDPDGQADRKTHITIDADNLQMINQDFGFYIHVEQSDLIDLSPPADQEGGFVRSDPDQDTDVGADAPSVENKRDNLEIITYPNPTTNWLRIEGLDTSIGTLRISNSQGKMVRNINLSEKEKLFPEDLTIDVSDLPAGAYHLQLISHKNLRSFPIVKM